MTLWAMLAAPLLAGNDLRAMDDDTKEILTNKEVLAIDQDKLGQQGNRISRDGDTEVWMRPLENGDLAVALFNRGDRMTEVSAYWPILSLKGKHKVRDLWRHDESTVKDAYTIEVAAHAAVLIRIAR